MSVKKKTTHRQLEDIHQEMMYTKFLNREYEFRHTPMKKEMAFYDYVKKGDEKKVLLLMKKLGEEGSGRLSENDIVNIKYHFIVTVAIITRMCVEGGMEMEEAYNLSDIYIRKMDKMYDIDSIMKLHRKAVLDYTCRMKQLSLPSNYSRVIIEAMDYIYDHLHKKILLKDIADAVHLSVSYLSRSFHEETGVSIGNYITGKRIETAENMLLYSEYSLDEIGAYLAFSSTSHFVNIFRKYKGCTPGRYRNKGGTSEQKKKKKLHSRQVQKQNDYYRKRKQSMLK